MLGLTSMVLASDGHDEIFVRPHEGDGLEPAAQETAAEQVRPLVDDVVGCKNDVSVEILRAIAEQA